MSMSLPNDLHQVPNCSFQARKQLKQGLGFSMFITFMPVFVGNQNDNGSAPHRLHELPRNPSRILMRLGVHYLRGSEAVRGHRRPRRRSCSWFPWLALHDQGFSASFATPYASFDLILQEGLQICFYHFPDHLESPRGRVLLLGASQLEHSFFGRPSAGNL